MLPPLFVPRFRGPVWRAVTLITSIADGQMPRSRTVRESNFRRPTRFMTRMMPWTRGEIFHTGQSLREGVRTQASISRSSRLAGREFVRANGGRPGQAMPTHGVAADPITDGTREPRRPAPRPRVAAASRGRLRARAAGEPSGAPPPGRGDARPGFVYLGAFCLVNMSLLQVNAWRATPLGPKSPRPLLTVQIGVQ